MFDKTKRLGSRNRSEPKSVKRRDQRGENRRGLGNTGSKSIMQGVRIWLLNIKAIFIPLMGH